MSATTNISNEKLMDICVKFMECGNAAEVRKYVNALWASQGSDFSITREQFYPNFALAWQRGLVTLTPEQHYFLGQEIAKAYEFEASDIKVIECRRDLSAVAEATARIVVKQIGIVSKMKGPGKRVHLGFGAGRTSALVAQHLANALRVAEDIPPLTLHAISSGFDVEEPDKSPASYFSFFRSVGKDIKFIGLFAPASLKASDYENVKTWPGVKEAFQHRDDIDIVITSFASAKDKHGDLNRFHDVVRGSAANSKTRVGDVQYRPYNGKGPVHNPKGMRAVTLFELEDLVELVRHNDKKVILVAGPCGFCGEVRTDALRPLMTNPKLKVWSQLVLDLDTAEQLRDSAGVR
ncbi:MAG: hypothetical protein JRH16_18240 [Deltaproteobacteria bacterium]|nr:hypothetical protein [Deltaproteobacteria bacterium]MBW2362718.1 hypothetical protein [Deltaproteobacteria bacterium]